MNAFVLEDHRELFRDTEAFNQFVQLLRKKLADDFSPVMSESQVVGAVVSAEAAKEVIFDRIAKRLSHEPEVLAEIEDRLQNDPIVDVDGIN